jgi:hypothetical protein
MLEILRRILGALSIAGLVIYAHFLFRDTVIVTAMVRPEGMAK